MFNKKIAFIFMLVNFVLTLSLSYGVCRLEPTQNANNFIRNQTYDYTIFDQTVIRDGNNIGGNHTGHTINHILPKVSLLKNFSRMLVFYRNNLLQNNNQVKYNAVSQYIIAIANALHAPMNQLDIDNISYTLPGQPNIAPCAGVISSIVTWLPKNLFLSPSNNHRFWDPRTSMDLWAIEFISSTVLQNIQIINNHQDTHPYTQEAADLFYNMFINNMNNTIYIENLGINVRSNVFKHTTNSAGKPYCINKWSKSICCCFANHTCSVPTSAP